MSSRSSLANLCRSKELESWISNPETRMVSLPGLKWNSVLWEIIAGILAMTPSFPNGSEPATEVLSLGFASTGVFHSLEPKGHHEGDSSSVSNLKEKRRHRDLSQPALKE